MTADGTLVLENQALRHEVEQLTHELADTHLLLRIARDQTERRQQTIDALRMALQERMNP